MSEILYPYTTPLNADGTSLIERAQAMATKMGAVLTRIDPHEEIGIGPKDGAWIAWAEGNDGSENILFRPDVEHGPFSSLHELSHLALGHIQISAIAQAIDMPDDPMWMLTDAMETASNIAAATSFVDAPDAPDTIMARMNRDVRNPGGAFSGALAEMLTRAVEDDMNDVAGEIGRTRWLETASRTRLLLTVIKVHEPPTAHAATIHIKQFVHDTMKDDEPVSTAH